MSLSDAYKEGLLAKSYADNPYPKGTVDYDDFERGVTQKAKRDSARRSRSDSDFNRSFKPSGDLKGSKVERNPRIPSINNYALAKKK